MQCRRGGAMALYENRAEAGRPTVDGSVMRTMWFATLELVTYTKASKTPVATSAWLAAVAI